MKPKDLTEHDHPERFYVWTKMEMEFINTRIRRAYEDGFIDGDKHAINSAVTQAITDPAVIRNMFERDCG
jgi:hypothetical protein